MENFSDIYLSGEEKPPSNIVFGTTQNRPTFPTDIAHDCFGNTQTPIRGVPGIGPGSYNNEEKTTFRYVLDHQPMSRRGYTFNARTEQRKTFVPKTDVPSPDAYQPDHSGKMSTKRAFKPFSAAAQRFSRSNSADGPG
ncbi:unnamed protein product, partial [Didymodactylos carnosus]